MLPVTHTTPAGEVTIRLAKIEDIDPLIEFNQICFPILAEENVLWSKRQLANHQKVFSQGKL